MTFAAFAPTSVLRDTSSLSKLPTTSERRWNLRSSESVCVPLPAPGAPRRISRSGCCPAVGAPGELASKAACCRPNALLDRKRTKAGVTALDVGRIWTREQPRRRACSVRIRRWSCRTWFKVKRRPYDSTLYLDSHALSWLRTKTGSLRKFDTRVLAASTPAHSSVSPHDVLPIPCCLIASDTTEHLGRCRAMRKAAERTSSRTTLLSTFQATLFTSTLPSESGWVSSSSSNAGRHRPIYQGSGRSPAEQA